VADIVGNGLLVSQGDFWRRQRRIMTPAFGNSSLKDFFSSIVETTKILLDKWSSHKTIDMRGDMTKITLDIIALAAFGYSLNALTDPKGTFPKAVTTILHETELRVFQLFPLWKLPFYPGSIRFEKAKRVLTTELKSMINRRRKEQPNLTEENCKDLLGRILIAKDKETGESLNDEQLLDEGMTILLAGHETTANATAFVFYLLGRYPDSQKKRYKKKLMK